MSADRSAAPGAPRRPAGLQAERTALAWSRTGLGVLLNAALVLRAGLLQQSKALAALGAVLLLAGAAVTVYGGLRKRQLLRSPALAAPAAAAVLALAGLALLTCAAAVPVLVGAMRG
ncbi:MAG: DUF202 domain-containing protein [Rubrivivax sp.]|nr:DUF202 domain-containing protein [Rubrivivax sp.]